MILQLDIRILNGTAPIVPQRLKPRKTPVQSRSGATVEAIHEAVIQVLLAKGFAGLTTTRVAERRKTWRSAWQLQVDPPDRDSASSMPTPR